MKSLKVISKLFLISIFSFFSIIVFNFELLNSKNNSTNQTKFNYEDNQINLSNSSIESIQKLDTIPLEDYTIFCVNDSIWYKMSNKTNEFFKLNDLNGQTFNSFKEVSYDEKYLIFQNKDNEDKHFLDLKKNKIISEEGNFSPDRDILVSEEHDLNVMNMHHNLVIQSKPKANGPSTENWTEKYDLSNQFCNIGTDPYIGEYALSSSKDVFINIKRKNKPQQYFTYDVSLRDDQNSIEKDVRNIMSFEYFDNQKQIESKNLNFDHNLSNFTKRENYLFDNNNPFFYKLVYNEEANNEDNRDTRFVKYDAKGYSFSESFGNFMNGKQLYVNNSKGILYFYDFFSDFESPFQTLNPSIIEIELPENLRISSAVQTPSGNFFIKTTNDDLYYFSYKEMKLNQYVTTSNYLKLSIDFSQDLIFSNETWLITKDADGYHFYSPFFKFHFGDSINYFYNFVTHTVTFDSYDFQLYVDSSLINALKINNVSIVQIENKKWQFDFNDLESKKIDIANVSINFRGGFKFFLSFSIIKDHSPMFEIYNQNDGVTLKREVYFDQEKNTLTDGYFATTNLALKANANLDDLNKFDESISTWYLDGVESVLDSEIKLPDDNLKHNLVILDKFGKSWNYNIYFNQKDPLYWTETDRGIKDFKKLRKAHYTSTEIKSWNALESLKHSEEIEAQFHAHSLLIVLIVVTIIIVIIIVLLLIFSIIYKRKKKNDLIKKEKK